MIVRGVIECGLSKAEAARRFNTTPKTVAKWVERLRAEAWGLCDRFSMPFSSPSQITPAACSALELCAGGDTRASSCPTSGHMGRLGLRAESFEILGRGFVAKGLVGL